MRCHAMIRLQDWAAARRADGGAAIKVRVVKGANLPMEQVEASLHDWPLATWGTKQDSDTNYKRVINYSLHPDRIRNIRIGVAGHNLFDIAFAWLLAKQRGVESGIEFEMLLGMAQGQAEAVKKDVGSLLLYTPVVHPAEFDVAIAYLIRRLEEGASQDNFMSAVFELSENESLFEREKQRFLASLAKLDDEVPAPNRQQNRALPAAPLPHDSFENTADTDPSLPANRDWGRAILGRVATSTLGNAAVEAATINDVATLNAVIDTAVEKGKAWGALSGAERADILHRAGDVLEARRADLLEVMASETGKTIDQGDPEVSEAVDFAHYYAESARKLDDVDGATFVPAKLTVVTPPWNFPVAIPAGSTLAALAAGSAVVIKPAKQARRSGAVMIEALWEAGVPRDVLTMVQLGERELGQQLISHPAVDRVILTGGYETAELFRSFRKDLPLLAETSGKNAIIVTPSADLDLAAKDVAYSAFGHAGQKCSAASLVILVGSVAKSKRFHNQLIDAVTSLKVGYPQDPASQMGPIIEPASGKLLNALTTLGEGENWAVEPRMLDDTGKLWSPGVRYGRPARILLPPHRILRPRPRRHDRGDPRGGHRDPEPDRIRPHRRPALAGHRRAGDLAGHRPGRQPLHQPRHHRRDRPAPALRRLEEIRRRRRHQGRRTELPRRPRRMGQQAQHRRRHAGLCSGPLRRPPDRGRGQGLPGRRRTRAAAARARLRRPRLGRRVRYRQGRLRPERGAQHLPLPCAARHRPPGGRRAAGRPRPDRRRGRPGRVRR